MHFITIATNAQHYFYSMKESAKRNNIKIEILGWGKKWGGFIWKFKLMKDKLKHLPKKDIVMFFDAYDIIFMKNEKEIEKVFLEYGKKILFGSICGTSLENYISKKIFKAEESPKKETCYDSLNSGCYIGYVENLYNLLNIICEQYDCLDKKLDDQIIMSKFYNENHKKYDIELDYQTKLVYNFESNSNSRHIYSNLRRLLNLTTPDEGLEGNHFIFQDNKFLVKKTNNYPCVIHGHGYTNIDSIINKLGLPKKIYSDNFTYSYKTFVNVNLVRIIIISILLVIVLAILYKKKMFKINKKRFLKIKRNSKK